MRIQSINQNNNISHKAYFKPNTEFKKLWSVRPKFFGNKLVDLRKNLPNHELEILTCEKVAGDFVEFCGAHCGKAVREKAVRRHGGNTLTVQGKVITSFGIPSVFVEKIKSFFSDIDITVFFVSGKVDFGEHIDDAPLHPHILVSVIN